MAQYKVPQDVEADDKLLGPFSFRQFIYLIVVALAIAGMWGLWQLLPPLAILPLPIVVFFGALALPLRKDQPMETYLAAIVQFYVKPRKRFWDPDGIESLIEITAPKTRQVQRTNGLSQNEAEQRLSYLANLVDTRGWSVRGINSAQPDTTMNDDLYFEAQQTEDILDDNNSVSRNLDQMIGQRDAQRHEDMLNRMRTGTASQQAQQAPTQPTIPPVADPYASLQPQMTQTPVTAQSPAAQQATDADVAVLQQAKYNPYPNNMRQTVVQPMSAQPQQKPQAASQVAAQPQMSQPEPPKITTSEKPVSAGIMNLANNHDLSIAAIAREANRIHEKEAELGDEEVIISLR